MRHSGRLPAAHRTSARDPRLRFRTSICIAFYSIKTFLRLKVVDQLFARLENQRSPLGFITGDFNVLKSQSLRIPLLSNMSNGKMVCLIDDEIESAKRARKIPADCIPLQRQCPASFDRRALSSDELLRDADSTSDGRINPQLAGAEVLQYLLSKAALASLSRHADELKSKAFSAVNAAIPDWAISSAESLSKPYR